MSIHRAVPIIPMPKRKRDQRRVHNAQHSSSTYDANVMRRAETALARGAKWFDMGGETYVLRGGQFVPWWKKEQPCHAGD